jgi:hypothetical protein
MILSINPGHNIGIRIHTLFISPHGSPEKSIPKTTGYKHFVCSCIPKTVMFQDYDNR